MGADGAAANGVTSFEDVDGGGEPKGAPVIGLLGKRHQPCL